MRLLPSQRAHLYVLERARVVVRDHRVEYMEAGENALRGFNIPVANTSFLLLGPGNSITQEAVRLLRQEGVCIGFCGSGGTPLLAAQDPYPDLLTPFDEYRDPRFLQGWIELWRDEGRRLAVAKQFFRVRLEKIDWCWTNLEFGVGLPDPPGGRQRARWLREVDEAGSVQQLFGIEGGYAKELYRLLATSFHFTDFERKPRSGQGVQDPNTLLDHGNYLLYGLASVVLWCLGIPPALAVWHGKSRRGALVFDLADVIKDGIVMPLAFASAFQARSGKKMSESDFRGHCITLCDDAKVLEILFNTLIKAIDQC
ncbi:type I-F CRISPR-associated endonuclease Cas1f [Candidatus Magnetaquicoccus inordinatus]|uniref:type I-F CRISPR-associated endonuclease Cas1f n=1 Tax=Candidatus Magnetaquicoccus inordinatus TaxID=2496818 RepID=UPI00102B80B7|nr:type I-F CRISPR-associated endonuclease Cas1f [Candidatus Magnetaquicoccus inordinatus]